MSQIKPIKGFENLYTIDSSGRVFGIKFNRYLKLQKDKDGYLHCGLCKNNKAKTYKVHRLVAITFIPNPNNLPQVNHIDANKANNNVSNLEWSSVKDQFKHAMKLNLMRKGEKINFSKLKEKEVIAIKKQLKRNVHYSKIAIKYKVSPMTIWDISKNRTWRHVK